MSAVTSHNTVEPMFRSRLSYSMRFADLAAAVAYQAGRPATFLAAAIIIVVWAITGPIFHFSDTWQLIINTGTTIVTFLMVFVIQNTQNRDGAAIQAKLDELNSRECSSKFANWNRKSHRRGNRGNWSCLLGTRKERGSRGE